MNVYPTYHRTTRYERIDQEEVPESKHTLFVRGLPGHIKTDEVKEFFEDHVGPCSFDFVKTSPDQLKLFVAVRFETRDAAKECLHKYKDGEVLGYPVDLSWFRDIRRYMSYQQSQGGAVTRPVSAARGRGGFIRRGHYIRNSYDRSSRNDYRDDEYDRGSKRMRTISGDRRSDSRRSRSRSETSSRTVSPSADRSSHERSRSFDSRRGSVDSRDSRNAHSHSRSPSATPPSQSLRQRSSSPLNASPPTKRIVEIIEKGSTPPLPPSPPPPTSAATKRTHSNDHSSQQSNHSRSASPVVERKSRKSKKDKKKRKRRSPSSSSATEGGSYGGRSSGELSEGELRKKILKKREKALREENGEAIQKTVEKTETGKWEEKSPVQNQSRSDSSLLQNTTLKFGLESNEDIPKHVVRDSQPQLNTKKPNPTNASTRPVGNASVKDEYDDMLISPPPAPPRTSKPSESLVVDTLGMVKKINKDIVGKNAEAPKVGSVSSGSLANTDIDSLLGGGVKRSSAPQQQSTQVNSSSLNDDLKGTQQSNTIQSLRGQQQTTAKVSALSILDDTDDPVQSSSGLRLSTFTRQMNAETERDRKMASLPPEMLSKFVSKKKQFDAALKADCETFGFVVKTLIQKDPGLEVRLRAALADAVRDMEDSFTQKVDKLLDQLIMFASM
ncbi:unnamed protein product [Anisakis simplex]|uniref:RRM domain-containing protein n=1 Tax=Anisakis simplex TaxID=6269 RepID=A0A0M3IYX2_ANISI|nr:unnamed protein product [Anisakis simplex]